MGLSRLLLCGDVRGAFPLLARFAKQIQQKQGPFDALVCCGSFFGPLSHRIDLQSPVKTEQDSGASSPKPVDEHAFKDNRNGVKHAEDGNEKTHLSDGEISDEVFVRDVIRKAHSEKLEELCSLSESFPFPVFLVDREISSLLTDSVSARSTGSVGTSTSRIGESQCSNGANSPLVKQEENTHVDTCPPSTPTLGSASGLQELPGNPSSKTAEIRTGGPNENLLGVCSSPIPICTNVFWLGNAGLAKIAGLRIAFFGMSEEAPWKDDRSAKGGGEPPRNGEPQGATEVTSASEPQEKKERKEVENDDRQVSCGEGGVDSNDIENEEGGSSGKRRRVIRISGEQGAETTYSCCQNSCDSLRTRESPDGLVNKGNLAKTALAKLVSQANEREWRGRIDVFISCLWPLGVTTKETDKNGPLQQGEAFEMLEDFKALVEKVDVCPDDLRAKSSRTVARVAAFLEPRYMIAASLGLFYQRPPFRGMRFGYVSKYISLGVLGEKRPEAKPIHALQLTPLDDLRASLSPLLAQSDGHVFPSDSSATSPEEAATALFALPANATSNPFSALLPPALKHHKSCDNKGIPSRDLNLMEVSASEEMTRFVHFLMKDAGCVQEPPAGPPPPPPPPAEGERPYGPRREPHRHQRPCCVVCVCNLPYTVEEHSLQRVMNGFGEVKFVYAPRDPEDQSRGTGKAFVVYFTPEGAAKAVEASGQLEAGNRTLTVAFWREKIPFAHKQQKEDGTPASSKLGSSIVVRPHAECWFCLANPKVEKHLVATVGDTCYITAPKGGLHPLHALIIPITHFPSVAFASEEVRKEIGQHVAAFRTALRTKANLDCIVYERYVPMRATKAMHTQVQCVPCTSAEGLRAAEFFKKKAQKAGLRLDTLPSERGDLPFSGLAARTPGTETAYFYLELPGLCTASGQLVERFLYVQSSPKHSGAPADGCRQRGGVPGERLPMNFGREVLAELMERPELADWQKCIVDDEEERARAAQIRNLLSD